jgi:CRP-like cAMP-binding protein
VRRRQPYKQSRDAIFIITDERNCPLYNVGEELKVENNSLTPPSCKASCLILADKLSSIVKSQDSFGKPSPFGAQKSRFDCGGCEGKIHFEYKKEKGYTTLQMKLLNEAEELKKQKHLNQFFGVLRALEMFEPLDNAALVDFTLLLELKTFSFNKVILKKGDPGSHLFIILNGLVSVIADDGSTITELGPGEIFGEMSLLSGEPIANSIYSFEVTQVAMLSQKNFKHVLKTFPVLQLFLFRLLVARAQAIALRSGNISSGMTGELSEIAVADLLQLINTSMKTGIVELSLDDGSASVYFNEGEIVHATFLGLSGQEAVFSLLTRKKGRFSYSRGLPAEMQGLEPIGGFMGMLMEGLQRIDEAE